MNIYREKWSLFLRAWSNNKFSYIYPTLLHIYNITSLTIANIIYLRSICNSRWYSPSLVWCGQQRIPPIPLELLVCDHVVGVCSASPRSNLKKGVNTYIWMKLNTIDGNKIKLWILFMYFKLFVRVAPFVFQSRGVGELPHVVSTEIILFLLPQALYENRVQSNW